MAQKKTKEQMLIQVNASLVCTELLQVVSNYNLTYAELIELSKQFEARLLVEVASKLNQETQEAFEKRVRPDNTKDLINLNK